MTTPEFRSPIWWVHENKPVRGEITFISFSKEGDNYSVHANLGNNHGLFTTVFVGKDEEAWFVFAARDIYLDEEKALAECLIREEALYLERTSKMRERFEDIIKTKSYEALKK